MVCEDLNAASNAMQAVNCISGTMFGLDWTLMAIVALGAIALIAYKTRLPKELALVFAWALVYMFDLMAGGTEWLPKILLLLSFGIGIMIYKGVISHARTESQ